LQGDFYCEPDDVVRGVNLSVVDAMGFSFSQACNKRILKKLDPSDTPPALSEEAKTHLEATTLQTRQYSPNAAVNKLLAFLRGMDDAQVLKVNPNKFTICASAILHGFACDFKIRIYQQEQGSIVEFQRRSGDTLAFLDLYHEASEYLMGPLDSQTAVDNVSIAHVDSSQPANVLAELAAVLSLKAL